MFMVLGHHQPVAKQDDRDTDSVGDNDKDSVESRGKLQYMI